MPRRPTSTSRRSTAGPCTCCMSSGLAISSFYTTCAVGMAALRTLIRENDGLNFCKLSFSLPLVGPFETMLPKPFYFDDTIWGADTWPLLSAAYTGDLDAVRQMLVDDPTR